MYLLDTHRGREIEGKGWQVGIGIECGNGNGNEVVAANPRIDRNAMALAVKDASLPRGRKKLVLHPRRLRSYRS